LIAIGPFPAEQARAAVAAERFDGAFSLTVDLNQLSTLYEMKLWSPRPRLCAHGCAGMFAAAITVTMIRLNKRRFDFKLHSTTEATATNRLAHGE